MKDKLRRKTETIEDRAIYVYLPSLEMALDWKRKAEKSGVSVSKFVIERVEDSLRSENGGEETYVNRAEQRACSLLSQGASGLRSLGTITWRVSCFLFPASVFPPNQTIILALPPLTVSG
jgi:hypothetical protein